MSFWGRLTGRRRLEAQLDAELRDHLERRSADLVAAGVSAIDARRRAALELGGVEQVKEACRDVRLTRWLEDLGHDLRYAWRGLRRSPAYTVVAVSSLALGIGANTAIFSLVDRLLVRPLPVHDPERLALLDAGGWTNPIWEQIRDRHSQLFESAAAWSDDHVQFDLGAAGDADLVHGLWVSGDFFSTLGVSAALGRALGVEDDRRGGGLHGPAAVVSHRFWRQRLGAASDIVGRSLTLNHVAYTIVGVMPRGFLGPTPGRSFDVAVPIASEPLMRGSASWLENRTAWWLEIVVRLKPGQTLASATSALRAVQPQIREAVLPLGLSPEHLRGFMDEDLRLISAQAAASPARRRYERPLLTLLCVSGLVLLLACANLANLMLARVDARAHELTLRLTLGASRPRLARQLLTESLLLAGLGAVLGIVFAGWGAQALVALISTPDDGVALDLALDWRVLAFALVVGTGTALLFGLAPVLRSRRADPIEILKRQAGRGSVGETGRSVSRPLLVLQVALSLVLVLAAGLFGRTLAALARQDVGFDARSVLLLSLDARSALLSPARRAQLFAQAWETARAQPGVAAAAVSALPPVSDATWNSPIDVEGQPPLSGRERMAWVNAVTPGWFATLGTRLRAGRDFDVHDRAGTPLVAVVNEAFARKFTNGTPPVGRILRQQGPANRPAPAIEIVGLVQDSVYKSMRDPRAPIVYLALAQLAPEEAAPFASVSVRADGHLPAESLRRSLSTAVSALEPRVSLSVRTLAGQVDAALARERTLATLSGFFGVLALLLAGIGLFGVTAYAVGRRRAEIGIRMALGADAARIVRLVLGRVLIFVAIGIAIGAVVGLWATRFVAALLFGVDARDPSTFLGAALVLALVAAIAVWVPARRAARTDPALVLHEG